MRGLLAIVALLAGCDQVLGLTERPGPDAPPPDEDNDGVPFANDNCPSVANPGQEDGDLDDRGDVCDLCPQLAELVEHDEDNDGVGDRCDNCPHLGPGDQANVDGDALGDQCDLQPARPNCIVLFDPFIAMPTPREAAIGTWIVMDDALHQTDPEIENGLFVFDTAAVTNPLVQTTARVLEIPSATTTAQVIGVWAAIAPGIEPGIPAGITSQLVSTQVAPDTNLHARVVSSDGQINLVDSQYLEPKIPLAVGSRTTVRVHLPTTTGFAVFGTIGQNFATAAQTLGYSWTPGHAGLRANDIGVAFEYVLITEQSASACAPR